MVEALEEAHDLFVSSTSNEFNDNRTLQLAIAKLIDTAGICSFSVSHETKDILNHVPWLYIQTTKRSIPKNRTHFELDVLWTLLDRFFSAVYPSLSVALLTVTYYDVLSTKVDKPMNTSSPNPVAECGTVFEGRNFTSITPSKFSNDTIARLAASSLRDPAISNYIRNIQIWFRRLNDRDRKELYGRLVKGEAHVSAFYELFFHEYFFRKGWQVEKDPRVANSIPDFMVTANRTKFLVEAFTVCDSRQQSRKSYRSFLTELDSLESNKVLGIHMNEWCTDIENDGLRKFIESWLKSIYSDTNVSRICVDDFGFKGHFIASPRGPVDSSPGLITEWTTPDSDPVDVLINSLRNKYRKYKFVKGLKIPFVLVGCLQDNTEFDEINICSRLFGSFQLEVTKTSRALRIPASENGRFFGATHHTNLSAIIVCVRRWNGGQAEYDLRVIHNPWARLPIPSDLFSEHPQLIARGEDLKFLEWVNFDKRAFVFRS